MSLNPKGKICIIHILLLNIIALLIISCGGLSTEQTQNIHIILNASDLFSKHNARSITTSNEFDLSVTLEVSGDYTQTQNLVWKAGEQYLNISIPNIPINSVIQIALSIANNDNITFLKGESKKHTVLSGLNKIQIKMVSILSINCMFDTNLPVLIFDNSKTIKKDTPIKINLIDETNLLSKYEYSLSLYNTMTDTPSIIPYTECTGNSIEFPTQNLIAGHYSINVFVRLKDTDSTFTEYSGSFGLVILP